MHSKNGGLTRKVIKLEEGCKEKSKTSVQSYSGEKIRINNKENGNNGKEIV